MTIQEHRSRVIVVSFFIFCLSLEFLSIYIGNDEFVIPKCCRPFRYNGSIGVVEGNWKNSFHVKQNNRNATTLRHAQSVGNCKLREVKLSPTPLPMTGLVNFPGSGNTWTRHLIQQMTGIGTSSVYCDKILRTHGFPYECHKERNKTVVVKTHLSRHLSMFKKIILLIRNPYDAMFALANFNSSGHTSHASKNDLNNTVATLFEYHLNWYIKLTENITRTFKGPVYILQYEKLKIDLATELKKLAIFLGQNVNEASIQCTVEQQEGSFHRKSSELEHLQTLRETYSADKLKRMHEAAKLTEKMLKEAYSLDIDVGGDLDNILLNSLD